MGHEHLFSPSLKLLSNLKKRIKSPSRTEPFSTLKIKRPAKSIEIDPYLLRLKHEKGFNYFMSTKYYIKTLSSLLVSAFLITSCSSNNEAAFCNAARTFGSTASELDVDAAASILGPNFWESLSDNVDDLKMNAPDAFKSDIENLESDLNQFKENLKANDYNLLSALLDPEMLESFTRLVETIRETIDNELTIFISENCN